MSKLDDIEAGTDTVMTKELVRLFKYAGCNPHCHACEKPIKVDQTFKLVPHKKAAGWEPEGKLLDEMCCAKCSEPELIKRDRRVADERTKRYYSSTSRQAGFVGGYSRPSKGA